MTQRIITPNGVEAHGKDARIVHKLVKKTAKEFAGAYYEIAASHDNEFYRRFPSQKQFVQARWKHFIVTAREVLTTMLSMKSTPDAEKVEIYEALQLQNELPWSMQENQIVNVPH